MMIKTAAKAAGMRLKYEEHPETRGRWSQKISGEILTLLAVIIQLL